MQAVPIRVNGRHIRPSRLFAVAEGLTDSPLTDRAHIATCDDCRQVLEVFKKYLIDSGEIRQAGTVKAGRRHRRKKVWQISWKTFAPWWISHCAEEWWSQYSVRLVPQSLLWSGTDYPRGRNLPRLSASQEAEHRLEVRKGRSYSDEDDTEERWLHTRRVAGTYIANISRSGFAFWVVAPSNHVSRDSSWVTASLLRSPVGIATGKESWWKS